MILIIDKEIKSYKHTSSLVKYTEMLDTMKEEFCVYSNIIVSNNYITIVIQPQKIVLNEFDMNVLMYEYFADIMVGAPVFTYSALGG